MGKILNNSFLEQVIFIDFLELFIVLFVTIALKNLIIIALGLEIALAKETTGTPF
jgi:hypothetical protein